MPKRNRDEEKDEEKKRPRNLLVSNILTTARRRWEENEKKKKEKPEDVRPSTSDAVAQTRRDQEAGRLVERFDQLKSDDDYVILPVEGTPGGRFILRLSEMVRSPRLQTQERSYRVRLDLSALSQPPRLGNVGASLWHVYAYLYDNILSEFSATVSPSC